MSTFNYFSAPTNFSEAREKFTAACALANTKPARYVHPKKGPRGEELSVDVARFGAPDASKVLLLTSGIHGTEGLAGAGCQTGWIAEGQYENLPGDVAVVMVHLINCHGVAYGEYQTDGYVDLNQNFRDFNEPLPDNPAYDDIHEAFCCPELQGPKRDEADVFLREYRAAHGEEVYWSAVWFGQHNHPDGFTYMGTEPAWSHQTLLEIIDEYVAGAEHVCLIDNHTAMGPFGYSCLWCFGTEEATQTQAREWFGKHLNTSMPCIGYADYFPVSEGYLLKGISRLLPEAKVISLAVEFGNSISQDQMMLNFQAHRWLKFHGDPDSALGKQITRDWLDGFYCYHPDWTDEIKPGWDRIIQQAITGLGKL